MTDQKIVLTQPEPLKKDIVSYDKHELKHVDTQEDQSLPTVADIYEEMLPDDLSSKAELKEIKNFVRTKLRSVSMTDYSFVPDMKEILEEKINTKSEVKSFDKSKMKHVDSVETDMRPTMGMLTAEMWPDYIPTRPELAKLQNFVKSYLKHVETCVKNPLPTLEDILAEERLTMSEVKRFKREKLHHSQSVEKNTLPDYATIWSEFYPDELPPRAEIKELIKFVHTDMKHVEPNIKQIIPTPDQVMQEKIDSRSEVKLFKKNSLRRVKTVEHNSLPTAADLWDEQVPDYIPPKPELDALKRFVKGRLKHVATVEKHSPLEIKDE